MFIGYLMSQKIQGHKVGSASSTPAFPSWLSILIFHWLSKEKKKQNKHNQEAALWSNWEGQHLASVPGYTQQDSRPRVMVTTETFRMPVVKSTWIIQSVNIKRFVTLGITNQKSCGSPVMLSTNEKKKKNPKQTDVHLGSTLQMRHYTDQVIHSLWCIL